MVILTVTISLLLYDLYSSRHFPAPFVSNQAAASGSQHIAQGRSATARQQRDPHRNPAERLSSEVHSQRVSLERSHIGGTQLRIYPLASATIRCRS